jgi:hypothetical protein
VTVCQLSWDAVTLMKMVYQVNEFYIAIHSSFAQLHSAIVSMRVQGTILLALTKYYNLERRRAAFTALSIRFKKHSSLSFIDRGRTRISNASHWGFEKGDLQDSTMTCL